jgi:protein SCO1
MIRSGVKVFSCKLSRTLALAANMAVFSWASPFCTAQRLQTGTEDQIRIDQRVGSQLSGALPFIDEEERHVHLSEYFGDKPVILVLGYYRCPMLCKVTLHDLCESLQQIKWTAGDQFRVIMVSIDPEETSEQAAATKQTFLRQYRRRAAEHGVHCLTGNQSEIDLLANQTGFRFVFDPRSGQFGHASGIILLSGQGRVTRYFLGIRYPPDELSTALMNAASDKPGQRVRDFILKCLHATNSRRSAVIMGAVRISALTMAIIVGLVIFRFVSTEKQTRR